MKICLLLGLILPLALAKPPAVSTKAGKVTGQKLNVYGTAVNEFLGVPYAKPPVGELRFKKPLPAEPWTKPLEAIRYSSSCMQVEFPFRSIGKAVKTSLSEDCLYLNIWAPKVANASDLKPVLVWFHGGSFSIGGTSFELYDGSVLSASEDVVVVTVNYRLGFLGFFTSNTPDAPGNVGLYDQNLALSWIDENISSFGGNPTLVTLFGESAGSFSVGLHMHSPLSQGLFHRSIMQSGGIYTPMVVDNKEKGLLKGNQLAELVGCSKHGHDLITHPADVVECLRTRSAEEIILAQSELSEPASMHFLPVYGEDFLPQNPIITADSGLFSNVELLIGHTSDEGSWFFQLPYPDKFPFNAGPANITLPEAKAMISKLFLDWGFDATEDLTSYYFNGLPPSDFSGIRQALIDAVGEYVITCPSVFSAERHTIRNRNVYYYIFTHRSEKSQRHEWMGATHTEEIPYVFGTPLRFPGRYTAVDKGFSLGIMKIWAEFARKGKPPVVNNADWPAFHKQNPVFMELNPHVLKARVLPQEFCEIWRKYF